MISNNYDNIDVFLNDYYFHNKQNGTFLQVGAYDGISDSITYSYEKQLNWNGVLIEPNKALISKIKQNRSNKDLILNVGIGGKDEILQFQVLPSRLDSSSFVLNDSKKEKLRSIGFNGQSYKELIQVLSYDSIAKISNLNKIDIAVIDVQGLQNVVLKSICKSKIKPTFVVVEFIHSDKQQLINIMSKNYDLVAQINKDLIFKRRYTVSILTRCCRVNTLDSILQNLNKTFNSTNFNYNWLLGYNKRFLNQSNVKWLNEEIKTNNPRNTIITKFFQPSGSFNFDSDLLNMMFFSQQITDSDYVYILDDDNIIHENFLTILEKNIQNQFDILTVNINGWCGNINDLPVLCDKRIDTANMVFDYNYLKKCNGFVCSLKGSPYIEDSLTFSRAIQNNAKIIYSQQFGAYYNYLR